MELAEGVGEKIDTAFREAGLSQEMGQKMVDLHNELVKSAAEQPYKLWQDIQADWVKQIKADPEIGGKLDKVKEDIGKLYAYLDNPKLITDFKAAMDFTGAGNHPAFVKLMNAMAQKVIEGGAVKGNGPTNVASPTGVRPSAADAMYPGGPKTGRA